MMTKRALMEELGNIFKLFTASFDKRALFRLYVAKVGDLDEIIEDTLDRKNKESTNRTKERIHNEAKG